MDKEKSDNSGMFKGNAEKKPAWNRLSNGDPLVKQVIEASSWPSLSETTKAVRCWNKSSSDSFKSLGGDGSSSSSSVTYFSQRSAYLGEVEPITDQSFIEKAVAFAISKGTNGTTTAAQTSGQSSSSYTSLRGQNQWNDFSSSQSHVSTQNQHQRNSNKSQNVSHHPHGSHGGRRNQEHVNQNLNPWFSQPPPRGGPLGFVRPPPPPPVPPFYGQCMPLQQHFYQMFFTELAPPMMYHPHRMPFIEPPPVLFPSPVLSSSKNESPPVLSVPLKTKILNQVQYYLSEENLPNDVYLRKRMNDEGFVHIELISRFNKLNALTADIQLILDSLQGSEVVEVQGYEIRNRHVWRKYVMPRHLRVLFDPSPEYAVAKNHQNMQVE